MRITSIKRAFNKRTMNHDQFYPGLPRCLKKKIDPKIWISCGFILPIILLVAAIFWRNRENFDFSNKHCVITGGSSGLGKAIASQLLKKGANVTIIARNKIQLDEATKSLEKYKKTSTQKLASISADVTDYSSIQSAIDSLKKIDVLFSCAGSSKPGFFITQNLDDFKTGMDLNYFGSLNAIKAVVNTMIKNEVKNGKIVLISSTLGLMGMIGYSQYSPTKFAIRGLAECLRQELIPYGIKTSVYFVSTIKTAGYENENLTKPKITRLIEEGDPSDPSPEARAKTLLKGIEKGQFYITSDIITDVFRVLGSGISPWNSLFDPLLNIFGQIIVPIWRHYSDYLVKKEHNKNK